MWAWVLAAGVSSLLGGLVAGAVGFGLAVETCPPDARWETWMAAASALDTTGVALIGASAIARGLGQRPK